MSHELTIDFAQEVLRDQIKPDLARVDISDIQRLVSKHFNVTEESLRGKRRTDVIAFLARWACTSPAPSPTSPSPTSA